MIPFFFVSAGVLGWSAQQVSPAIGGSLSLSLVFATKANLIGPGDVNYRHYLKEEEEAAAVLLRHHKRGHK